MLEDAAAMMLATPSPPPCGTIERPHLVSPEDKAAGRVRCWTCGDGWLDEMFQAEIDRLRNGG